ncbi:amidohydrolase [Methyloglobulus sp.]|uniref:amidohydrolase n=1 Tax=Methyloglobulus sp. TaxID=2518622 RepID=UPI0032B7E213
MTTKTIDPEWVLQAVDAVQPIIEQASDKLWQLAEVSLQEIKSAEYLLALLQEQGFTIVSTGTAGIPTAFVAEWGTGGPKLGILLEYDALPGLGNEAVSCKQPRKDGTTSGHGCGHNLIGSASLGSALALKQAMTEQGISGTLRVYGCASEETEGAKIYMAREKLFQDLDAVLHCHPFEHAIVANLRTAANNSMRVEFMGTTAHAGVSPWLGRSSVHAAELFAHSINLMREHVEPTARLHYVYENAGLAPNVVPDYAKIWLTARDVDRTRVNATTEWLRQAAEGAAMATQTKCNFILYYGLYDLLPNTPLAQRMQTHLERVGVPDWSEEEQTFARELQKNFGVEPKGMPTKVVPLQNEPTLGGGTDVGDISWNVPTMGIAMPSIPSGISLHTWAATATHGMSIGKKAAVAMAKIMAVTGLDILTDSELRQAAKADFERRTAGKPYVSPLPDDRKQPFGMPEWITEDACREMFSGVKGDS